MRKVALSILVFYSSFAFGCGCEDAGAAIATLTRLKDIYKSLDGDLSQVFKTLGQSQKNTVENQKNNAQNAEKIKKLEAEMLLSMSEISFLSDKSNQLKTVGNQAEAAKIDADLAMAEKTEFSRVLKMR
jgi:hypothetical protein